MNNQKNCSGVAKNSGTGISLLKGISLLSLPAIIILNSCGPSRAEMEFKEKQAAIADSVSNYLPGISADTVDGLARFFIRKADMKLKVNSVLETSEKIEDIVSQNGGYIASNEFISSPVSSSLVRHTKDSVIEIKRVEVVGKISLRVPASCLDSVLRYTTHLAKFVDYKTVNSNDVKMKLFANQLAEERYKVYRQRLKASDVSGGASQKALAAKEDKLLEKQNAADDVRIESYTLADQVNYSLVTLELYQSPQIVLHSMPAEPEISAYSAPFLSKLSAAFLDGCEFIKKFILWLVGCWGVLAVLLSILLVIKILIARLNTKQGAFWK